ncbi:MAG: zinc-dependent metalloprotease [Chitinophagaceae bacterium]|nr:zinc-dependent metalloprotease [Chitinophagaceae bacterium]
MHAYLSRVFLLIITMSVSMAVIGQPPTGTRPDTARRTPPSPTNGPKPYKEVITSKAISDGGLFWVHKVEDKYYFEIPDSLFNREILVVNRISKASAGMRSGGFFGYGGDQIGQNVVRFEKGPNNKVFLRTISFAEYAKDSTSPMFLSVTNSNIQPIAASFDIKALGKDSTGAVIDITDYISGDNDVLHFNSSVKSALRLAAVQTDKSYVVSVKSYPINIEIRAVKTYSRSPAPATTQGQGGASAGGNMTMELNSSLVILPKVPMQARHYDPRVGYFAVGYTDFDADPQGVKNITLVKRWRLEPKDGDWEKYKRGELVEPKKPIIFYIDPATPKKWVPYLMQGVDDWKQAFEKAGFKNAIMAKMAPTREEDSTWSLDDARNSAIVYKPSDIPNASGPSISDPRSGEIIESHINWYHNVMSLVRDWYFIQTAAVDPRARKMSFDDDLMGRLIRFVSSHEVGHTLGLRHNYGSSSSVPVEKLRDKVWLEANGHTPSIMDYARFNYVAQPEDNISGEGLMANIGDYDRWAIDWGYRLFPQYKSPEEEKGYLNNWVIGKLKDKRLWFGTESNPDDPRSQSEQVGDDAMKASTYGIKNLQRIVSNLVEWTKEPNAGYSNLTQMYNSLSGQFSRYIGHVSKYVGGVMETPKMVEEAGPVYEIVPEAKQREAVDFLNKNLFTTPVWMLNQDIFGKTGISGLTTVGLLQDNALNRLLSSRTLGKLVEAEASIGNNAYQVIELLNDLKKGVWTELAGRKPIDIYRRNLQKSYVSTLINLLAPSSTTTVGSITISTGGANDKSDIKSVVRAHLVALRLEIIAAVTGTADTVSKFHLQDVAQRIDNALNPSK